jgi:hypothetical protein
MNMHAFELKITFIWASGESRHGEPPGLGLHVRVSAAWRLGCLLLHPRAPAAGRVRKISKSAAIVQEGHGPVNLETKRLPRITANGSADTRVRFRLSWLPCPAPHPMSLGKGYVYMDLVC